MRQTLLPVLLALVGCAAGDSVPGPTANPGPPGSPWADALSGDGELKGASSGSGATTSGSFGGGDSMAEASGSAGAVPGSTGAAGGMSSSGSAPSGSSSGGVDSESSGTSGSNASQSYGAVLTAGAWDDNKNFDFFSQYRSSVTDPGLLDITEDEARAAAATFGVPGPAKTALDISLVIDTTGSMGDEISYLQREFTTIAQTIQAKYAQAEQHWSLVLYKDTTDAYVVKWFDFRADTNEFRTKLLTASAGGGGDFPEAPEQALGIAHRLSWRRDANVARLLFWVADAPHHDKDAKTLTTAVRSARDKGIHLYPVASSGIDELTEHTMRSAAQLTGGRYIFLTSDSGIGGAHKEPSTPCYFVTKLDSAILRMVDVELTGAYREPEQAEILRTSGNPQSGICQASSGPVAIY